MSDLAAVRDFIIEYSFFWSPSALIISSEKKEHFAADNEYRYLFLAAWNLDQEFGSSMLVLHCFSAFLLCHLRMVKFELNQGTLGWTDRVYDVAGACLSKRLCKLQLYWGASTFRSSICNRS